MARGQINQPSNQIKLTNVSLVRLKKGKKRFELACYRNKVSEWRSGIEKNLDDVLQIPSVFLNVSKGQVAPKDELEKAFGKGVSQDDIVLEILRKGEIQVTEKERAEQTEKILGEMTEIIAQRVVDPRTKRAYTKTMIGKALDMLTHQALEQKDKDKESGGAAPPSAPAEGVSKDNADGDKKEKALVWRGVTSTKSAKTQALEAIRVLLHHQPIPIAIAKMKLRVSVPASMLKNTVKTHHRSGSKGQSHAEGSQGASSRDHDGEAEGGERKSHGTLKDTILAFFQTVESQDVQGTQWEVVGLTEPGALNHVSEFVTDITKGKGKVDVLNVEVEQKAEADKI
jgi:ribosome maturation protein SDO1